jgi:hypothetical protein
MPRLLYGNFEFEHRLADLKRKLPAKLNRINAELATSWLAIAEDGDYLWTPEPIDASFFERAVDAGLPRVHPVVALADVPRGTECLPWGWTDDVRHLCDKHGWARNDPSDSAVRTANSRRFSFALEQEWCVGLELAGQATSVSHAEQFLMRFGSSARWVVKAEFGMAGRERLIGSGAMTSTDRNWIDKRLDTDGAVFLEPWVDRIDEVGIQIDVPRHAPPRFIDLTELIVDPRGQYGGSLLRTAGAKQSCTGSDPAGWDFAVDVAMRAAARIQDLGYFGPVGIDAMRYRGMDGTCRVRPLQDINARWTMGRLSLGWRRLLNPGETGYWQHCSTRMPPTAVHEAFVGNLCDESTVRRIETSPEWVGSRPATHASALWISG